MGSNRLIYFFLLVFFVSGSWAATVYDKGASATVGIQSPPKAVQYSYNQPKLCNGLAINFMYNGTDYSYTTGSFNWITPTSSATSLKTGCDDCVHNFTSPFDVRVYDTISNDIYVTSNGVVSVGSSFGGDYYNYPLPYGSAPAIMLWWDDLGEWTPDSNILYEVVGSFPNRKLVITYVSMTHFWYSWEGVTFQVIFYENDPNKITLQYLDTEFNGPGTPCQPAQPEPSVSFEPLDSKYFKNGMIDFGDVIVNQSDTSIIRIKNTGSMLIYINDMDIEERKAIKSYNSIKTLISENYQIDLTAGDKPCNSTTVSLEPGNYCTVGLKFSPMSYGKKEAIFKVYLGSPIIRMYSIDIAGNGVTTSQPQPQPQPQPSPSQPTSGGGGCKLTYGANPVNGIYLLVVGILIAFRRIRKKA